MDKINYKIYKLQLKNFNACFNEYTYFFKTKRIEELFFVSNNIDININSNNQKNYNNSITFSNIKYCKKQKINFLNRFKIFLLFYMIFFILLNINEILCESYIIVKIHK